MREKFRLVVALGLFYRAVGQVTTTGIGNVQTATNSINFGNYQSEIDDQKNAYKNIGNKDPVTGSLTLGLRPDTMKEQA